MNEKKGNLLQRTVALLLSVVLAAGMALDAVPLTVMAQENAGNGIHVTPSSSSTVVIFFLLPEWFTSFTHFVIHTGLVK